MQTLLVAVFDDAVGAESLRQRLFSIPEPGINPAHIITAERSQDGDLSTHHDHTFTADGAILGGLWGGALGMLLLNPLLGSLAGAALGGEIGSMGDNLIHPRDVRALAEHLKSGMSALFLPVTQEKADEAEGSLHRVGCKVIRIELTPEGKQAIENLLQDAGAVNKDSTTA